MPDQEAVGLQDARCQDIKCNMLLARLWLEGNSRVEIQFRRGGCQVISTFTSSGKSVQLEPDGQGGYNRVEQTIK